METTNLQRERQSMGSESLNFNLPVNINWPERIVSITAGARLLTSNIRNIASHPLRNSILTLAGGYLVYRGLTGNDPLYSRFGISTSNKPFNINIKTTVVVNRPKQEVYDFWRRLENLPLFMTHLERVEKIDEKRSHWEVKLPADVATVSWDAEIVNDEPGRLIAWKSIPGSTIENAGRVEFIDAPGNQGTVIKAVISYLPPAGGAGSGVAKLLNPVFERLVKEDIKNFKQYMEAGELPSGKPVGRKKTETTQSE